ncbi:aminomethyltransferase family protein [Methylobacillus gramineus]|uniref:aminomethyltransferase family protein n=1 Tax=Methylobacillus gramineus TaxID=755169 RepID=UPI001CFF7281|nr:aminomethyltransferase family protein [Methylobacillus gramineus]MCB5185234.1 aminomethyltransferase family protein [Methylobacillus gramineus]
MSRNSILNERHRALGSKLDGETWNDMPIPWSYDSDVHDEVVAVRSSAGLYDVSALNVVNVTGPDAEKLVDQLVARDITRLKPGTSLLAAELSEVGAICDDIMVIRDSATAFRLSHGSGQTPVNLAKLSAGLNVEVKADLGSHILSLQGPKSLEVLNPLLDFDLESLAYFQHKATTIFGKEVYIARGGYSGELGYEVYCRAEDAILIWDEILKAGASVGVIPASWNSLELTRIEAALLFFPFEMPESDTTPWEVNMGWGVDLDKKGDYLGKEAVLALKGRERIRQVGLICRSNVAVEAGAEILHDGKKVGVVTSASYSRYLMQSLALAHISPELAVNGTDVKIQGKHISCDAYVAPTPFYDPLRLRTHPRSGV